MSFNQLTQHLGKQETYVKKAHVFMQGENNQYIYIINRGVLKAYYHSEEGKEYIKSFLFAGDVIASLQALGGGKCSFSLQCLRPTQLIKLPYQQIKEDAKQNPELAVGVIELLTAFGIKKEQREFELLCLSAEQRYKNLLTRAPDIYSNVTQNDIAHYLGITPVALSRIKNKRQGHDVG